MADHDADGF